MERLTIELKLWMAVKALATRPESIVIRMSDAYLHIRDIDPNKMATEEARRKMDRIHAQLAAHKAHGPNPISDLKSDSYERLAIEICALFGEIIHEPWNHHP